MKERPILFTPEHVVAIREKRKTQTRRALSDQPRRYEASGGWGLVWGTKVGGGSEWLAKWCPYGQPGDQLWVREAHIFRVSRRVVLFKSDYDPVEAAGLGGMYGGWKSPMFLPRSYARTFLEITAVRVERVQDISEADARAEGIHRFKLPTGYVFGHNPHGTPGSMIASTAKLAYGTLWDSINAKREGGIFAWENNPWCWVIEFKRIKQ